MVRTSPFVCFSIFFFFNDSAPTEIYTLSLHDALPISLLVPLPLKIALDSGLGGKPLPHLLRPFVPSGFRLSPDRKSTRLNSSHVEISYAVFCLKKKNQANRCKHPRQMRV